MKCVVLGDSGGRVRGGGDGVRWEMEWWGEKVN